MRVWLLTLTLMAFADRAAPARADDGPIDVTVTTVAELREAVRRLPPAWGGAITLGPGVYDLDAPVVIEATSCVSILGAGWDKTVVRRNGDGDALVFRGACNSCSVRNLRIVSDAKARKGSGIVFEDTDWSGLSTIDTCLIEDFAESGIRFAGRIQTPQSSHIVRACLLRNNRAAQIDSVSNNDFTFQSDTLVVDRPEASNAVGISMELSSAGTVWGCRFSGCRVGLKMGKACSMDRVARNWFEECRDSAIDCGMETPPDFDVAHVPPEQLYVAWEWSVPHPIRMTTEAMFCGNTITTSGSNPAFVALNSRNTLFATVYGNRVIAARPIRSVVRADRNCLQWIVRGNALVGEAAQDYDLARPQGSVVNGNTVRSSEGAGRPQYHAAGSELSRRLLSAIVGRDTSGRAWFRRVATVDELERAAREAPAVGGTIYVAAGVYRLRGPLVFENKRRMTILGSGASCFLKGAPEADALVFRGDCRDCFVGGLNLSPEKATPWRSVEQKAGSGIVFRGRGRGLTVDSCILDNWPVWCVRFEGSPATPMRGVRVSGCWIVRGRQAQLYLKGCRDFVVSDNQIGYSFEDKSPAGALLEHCTDGLYQLNYHWGNRNGIVLAGGCERVRILDNRSEQSKESGLLVESRNGTPNRKLTIAGNTFHTNPELDPGTASNVTARGAEEVAFTANQIYTWWEPRRSRHGVELDDACRRWRFEANYVRDYEGEAIHAGTGSGHRFAANLLNAARPRPHRK